MNATVHCCFPSFFGKKHQLYVPVILISLSLGEKFQFDSVGSFAWVGFLIGWQSPLLHFFFQLHAPLFNLIRVSFSSTLLKNVSLNAEALGNFLHHKDFQRAVFLLWAGEREVPRKRWRESLVTCYKWGRNN